jgi:hypothetical protein
MFLFSSVLELYLCLKSRPYGHFYYEISGESVLRLQTLATLAFEENKDTQRSTS